MIHEIDLEQREEARRLYEEWLEKKKVEPLTALVEADELISSLKRLSQVNDFTTRQRARELYRSGLVEMGVAPLAAISEAEDYVASLVTMDEVYGFIYYTGGFHDYNEPYNHDGVAVAPKVPAWPE